MYDILLKQLAFFLSLLSAQFDKCPDITMNQTFEQQRGVGENGNNQKLLMDKTKEEAFEQSGPRNGEPRFGKPDIHRTKRWKERHRGAFLISLSK